MTRGVFGDLFQGLFMPPNPDCSLVAWSVSMNYDRNSQIGRFSLKRIWNRNSVSDDI